MTSRTSRDRRQDRPGRDARCVRLHQQVEVCAFHHNLSLLSLLSLFIVCGGWGNTKRKVVECGFNFKCNSEPIPFPPWKLSGGGLSFIHPYLIWLRMARLSSTLLLDVYRQKAHSSYKFSIFPPLLLWTQQKKIIQSEVPASTTTVSSRMSFHFPQPPTHAHPPRSCLESTIKQNEIPPPFLYSFTVHCSLMASILGKDS